MPDELRDEIGAALRELSDGEGATIKAVRAQRVLVTLECAIGEATGGGRTPARLDEIAAAVVRFLEAAADSLEPDKKPSAAVPNEAMAARAALGLKPELNGKPWTASRDRAGRQVRTAEWLGMDDKARLDKRLADGTTARGHLLERMAEQLSLRDSEFVAETRRLAQRERRPPLESAMRVEWLNRFERYYEVWAPIGGLRHDLEMALDASRRGDNTDAEIFVRKSLYYYTAFLTERERFVSQHGGLWILPDVRTEDAIADTMWFLREPTPFDEISESLLGIAFVGTPELVAFMHETFANRHLQPFLASWRRWIYSCRCKHLNRPRNDCKVHATIRWACFYMEALDKQWDFLSDWYDRPRSGTKVDPVRQRKRSLPTLPPTLPVDNATQKG